MKMMNNIDYIPDQHVDDGLFTYTVIREDEGEWDYFLCEAEDEEHAEEQSLNADPDMPVLWVNRGLNFSMENVYKVTIRATVTKTYTVNASSEDEAVEEAHQIFSVLEDGVPEDYDQDTLEVERVDMN
jgi:hypothetical protein